MDVGKCFEFLKFIPFPRFKNRRKEKAASQAHNKEIRIKGEEKTVDFFPIMLFAMLRIFFRLIFSGAFNRFRRMKRDGKRKREKKEDKKKFFILASE